MKQSAKVSNETGGNQFSEEYFIGSDRRLSGGSKRTILLTPAFVL